MKRRRLNFTGVGEVLKKEAEERLQSEDVDYGEPKCDNGYTVEFYNDLNVDLPQELKDRLKSREKGIELEDDDFEETYSDVMVYEDEIKFYVTDINGTTIFLNDDISLSVLETVDDIDDYLDFINRNWLEKIRDYVIIFFRKKFKKKTKKD